MDVQRWELVAPSWARWVEKGKNRRRVIDSRWSFLLFSGRFHAARFFVTLPPMSDDFRDASERAFAATALARTMESNNRSINRGNNKNAIKEIEKLDIGPQPGPERKDPHWYLTELKLQVIGTLRNIKRYSYGQIDTILHLPKGTSKQLAEKYPKEIQLVMRNDMDVVLDQFYRNKISILENLMVGAPNTIKFLVNIQSDTSRIDDQRIKAGDRIFDWTRLIMTTKNPSTAAKILSEDLRKVADEADAVMEMFQSTLGSAAGNAPDEN